MQIDRIKVSNFKGFSELDQRLNSRFTLIVGRNGVGKSSLLDALSIAFGSFLLGIPVANARHIDRHEAREFEREINGSSDFIRAYPVVVEAEGKITDPVTGDVRNVLWRRELGSARGRTTTKDAKDLSLIAERAYRATLSKRDPTLPLLSYYGTGRLWIAPNERKRQRPSRFDAYKNSHEPRVSSIDLLDWLRRERLKELEESQESPLLKAWITAVNSCFDEPVEVSYSPSRERLEVKFEGRSDKVSYDNLSHGQRNILSMIGDIAFKALILNPHLGAAALKEVQGIILIDEIDLHLHPRWQRILVPTLLNAFPRMQFVATTHSPFIIQSLSEGVLLDLDKNELDDRVYNMSLQDIVEDVQNVANSDRSSEYIRKKNVAESYLYKIKKLSGGLSSSARAELEAELDDIERGIEDPGLAALLKIQRLSNTRD